MPSVLPPVARRRSADAERDSASTTARALVGAQQDFKSGPLFLLNTSTLRVSLAHR
jgi:hypothetical protein